jgi:CRP-like cAMP-binding protein
MIHSISAHQPQQFDKLHRHRFERREYLPMLRNVLWQIESGCVRTCTLLEDGSIIPLGLWGAGDWVGLPLAGVNSYQVECLGKVSAYKIECCDCQNYQQVIEEHLQQSQMLLAIRNGTVSDRLKKFLVWLANNQGTESSGGYWLPDILTHQDIAEMIGTSRVTITRLLGQFEQEGLLRRMKKRCHLLKHLEVTISIGTCIVK